MLIGVFVCGVWVCGVATISALCVLIYEFSWQGSREVRQDWQAEAPPPPASSEPPSEHPRLQQVPPARSCRARPRHARPRRGHLQGPG